MARPDPTPPDDTLFPISPCHTAELDGKALDAIAAIPHHVNAHTITTRNGGQCAMLLPLNSGEIARIYSAVRSTGREV